MLRNYTKIPVWIVGPLIPPALLHKTCEDSQVKTFSTQHCGKKPGISPAECLQWLDSQNSSSVLYVSFGSQNTISRDQMIDLANGLELSNTPFVWVIRPPLGFDMRGEFRPEWLPENFEDRVVKEKKQGLLVKTWAP